MFTTSAGRSGTIGRNTAPLTSAKIAELTPMPSAKVIIAREVNPGDLQSCRSANRKSFMFVNVGCRPYSGCESILHDLAIKQMHGALSVPGKTFVVRNHTNRCATGVQLF